MGPSSGAGDAELQARNRQHAIVADLGRRALEGEDPHWLMHEAAAALADTLDADQTGFFTLSPDRDELVLREGVGWRGETGGPVGGPAPPGMLGGPPLAEGQAVVIGEGEEPIPPSDLLTHHDVVSGIVAPLLVDGEPLGLVGAYSSQPRSFSPTDTDFVQSVANTVASALAQREAPPETEESHLLEHVVETSPVGILVLDPDGEILYVNERTEAMLGRSREEMTTFTYDDPRWTVTDLAGEPLPPEDMPFSQVIDAGESVFDMEVGLERADGQRIWTRMNGAPMTMRTPAGEGMGAVFTMMDVTEHRHLEAEFEEMLERVTDAFYALDEEFCFTHVNEAAERFLQRPAEELLGEQLWELYPEAAEIDDVWDAFHRAMEEQETTGYELYFPPLDFWVDATVYPSESGVSVYFQDVTERRERERELRESQERYKSLTEDVLDSSEVGTIILDDSFQVEWANRRIGEFLGTDRDALIGADKRERIWAELRHVFDHPEGFEQRLLAAYEDNSYVMNFECHVLPGEDRPERWLEHWSKPIETGLFEGGRIEHYYDITHRKERERQLQESEAKFRTLAENLTEIVWMTTEDPEEFVYINPAFEEVWGLEREQLYAEPLVFLEQVHADDRERVREAYAGLPEEPYDEEYRVVQPDGEVRWVHARAVEVHDEEGETVRIVGIAEDTTERQEFEARLAESERKHRTLVENFPDGAVGMFDEDLRYTVAGGRLLEDLGLDPDEIVGRNALERYPEEVLAVVEPRFRAALEGEASRFEMAYHGRELLAHTIPVAHEDSEVYAGMLVVQDITERKEAEQRLRASEALYRTMAENFPDGGVGVYDEDLRYTLVEGTMWDDIEPDAEDLEGETIFEALPAETAADIEGIFRAALEGEKGTAVSQLGGRTYRVWAAPLRDSDGEITGGLSFAVDLTDQLERQRALEESRQRYRTLVENFPNGAVALVDEGLVYRMVGGTPPEGVEPSLEELQGMPVAEAVPTPLAEELVRCYEAAFEGEASSFERASGGRFYRFRIVPVRDEDGEVFAAMGTSQDITDAKERERRLEESNERLEQFAYAASHDLQEPLRMVSTYLQLIETRYGEHLDEEGREFFAYAVDGARRMREMIKSLLEYSRVRTEGRPLQPTDSDAVFEDVLADLRLRIEETEAQVTTGELPTVQADPDQLGQVFRNLLSNALKYAGDEPPRVHVDAERTDGEWRFAVRDEGIGIASEHTERIFEVFRRLEGHGEGAGTGIGLALCQQIVDRHGGRMWVDSEPGEGSTFFFTVPAVPEDDPRL